MAAWHWARVAEHSHGDVVGSWKLLLANSWMSSRLSVVPSYYFPSPNTARDATALLLIHVSNARSLVFLPFSFTFSLTLHMLPHLMYPFSISLTNVVCSTLSHMLCRWLVTVWKGKAWQQTYPLVSQHCVCLLFYLICRYCSLPRWPRFVFNIWKECSANRKRDGTLAWMEAYFVDFSCTNGQECTPWDTSLWHCRSWRPWNWLTWLTLFCMLHLMIIVNHKCSQHYVQMPYAILMWCLTCLPSLLLVHFLFRCLYVPFIYLLVMCNICSVIVLQRHCYEVFHNGYSLYSFLIMCNICSAIEASNILSDAVKKSYNVDAATLNVNATLVRSLELVLRHNYQQL